MLFSQHIDTVLLHIWRKTMTGDMTKDNVFKSLIRFTGPLILSGLLQQLYYITDSVIVGNYVGELGLARQ